MKKEILNTEVLYSELSQNVNSLIEGSQHIFLSIYDELDEGENFRVRCPDVLSTEAIIDGDCKFCIPPRSLQENPIFSLVLNSPSWRDILNTANEMVKARGDHSSFLVDIASTGEGMYEFVLV